MTAMCHNSLNTSVDEQLATTTDEKKCHFDDASSRLGRQWASRHVGPNSYPYVVTASVATYWMFVSLIPIYNKYFFDKTLYPYPIATAGIQLGLVSFVLGFYNLTQHYCYDYKSPNETQQPRQQQSWIFGLGFWYKLQWTLPIGFLFGLKYGVTNLGLQLVPAPTHLLLQSTDLVWTCLAAWVLNKERLAPIPVVCLLGCVFGSVILSCRLGRRQDSNEAHEEPTIAWWAILINLVSPILLGLCITTLRVACTKLMKPQNPRLGNASMDATELTCIKLAISSLVAIALACLLEQGDHRQEDKMLLEDFMEERNHWYTAFGLLPRRTKLGVLGGSFFILVFQVNCTFLTYLTSAVGVGLVGQVKIIPQWIVAALLMPSPTFHLALSNVVGAVVTMASAAAFALHDYVQYLNDTEKKSHNDGQRRQQELDRESTPLLSLWGTDTREQNRLEIGTDSDSPSLSDYDSIESRPHNETMDTP